MMRSFVVDVALNVWGNEDSNEDRLRGADSDFYTKVITSCTEAGRSPKGRSAFVDSGCKYHEHVAKNTPCYKTMF